MFMASAMAVPLLLLKNAVDGFLYAEFRIVVFYKVFNTLCECGTLPSVYVSSERTRKRNMEEQENILDMVQLSPTTSTRRLSARIWRTLHEDGLYPFHPKPVRNLHPGDSAMRLEFCHWLHTNRQLLPLILFTDELLSPLTESTTHVTRINGLTKIHTVLWKQIFNVVFLSMCGAV